MGQVMQGRAILIVEDGEEVLAAYLKELSDLSPHVLIHTATCFSAALALVQAHPDLLVIAVDGCFPIDPGGEPNPSDGQPCAGELFIRTVLENGYRGIILACSSAPEINDRMMALASADPQRKAPRVEYGGKGYDLTNAVRRHVREQPAS